MKDNPGFRLLKEALENFARKYDTKDLAAGAIRAAAAAGKATVDQGQKEFPKTFIANLAKDIYGLISSQEVSDGLSSVAGIVDEAGIQAAADDFLSKLKDPRVTLEAGKRLKDVLSKVSADEVGATLDGLLEQAGMGSVARGAAMVFIEGIKPILEELKEATTDEEIAARMTDIIDSLPTDFIAGAAGSLTSEITPERISQQTQKVVDKLPSPQALSDIVEGLGDVASRQFEKASKLTAPGELGAILKEFATEAKSAVTRALAKDTPARKNRPKGGSYNL